MGQDWTEERLVSYTDDIPLSKSNKKLKILKRGGTCSNVSIFKRPI